MHPLDEVAEHLLGHIEVGDHAVLQWANGLDVRGSAADHALGLGTHGKDGSSKVSIATTDGSFRTTPRPRT